MIVFKTSMNEIPASCSECLMSGCALPVTRRDYTRICKAYLKKRHPGCPLMEVPDTSTGKEAPDDVSE